MKLKVKKLDSGKVRVELTTDPAKKPVAAELRPDQIESVLAILGMAASASVFEFELSL